MSGFLQFIAFLLVFKYAVTGANTWLRHGYDGAEFNFSNEYREALAHWKKKRRDELERRRQEADQDSASPV